MIAVRQNSPLPADADPLSEFGPFAPSRSRCQVEASRKRRLYLPNYVHWGLFDALRQGARPLPGEIVWRNSLATPAISFPGLILVGRFRQSGEGLNFMTPVATDKIALPKQSEDYADRSLDCQFAIEPAFQELASQAKAAGWSEEDVSAALLELAYQRINGIAADCKTQLDIEDAARSIT